MVQILTICHKTNSICGQTSTTRTMTPAWTTGPTHTIQTTTTTLRMRTTIECLHLTRHSSGRRKAAPLNLSLGILRKVNMNRSHLLILCVVLIASCADTHKVVRTDSSPGARLDRNSTVYVAVPRDGVYGANTYYGSGQNTAQVLLAAFAKHTRNTEGGQKPQSYKQARETALSKKLEILVYPVILHWEDRATEWSGIPDRVEVKVDVVDAASDRSIASAVVKGVSGIATLGGDRPQDLLEEPVEQFVASLY